MLALALINALLAAPAPADPAEAPAVREPEAAATIVLVTGQSTEEIRRADVITAHLFGLAVGLTRADVDLHGELVDKHAHAVAAAQAHAALATYWVESPRAGTLELFVARPGQDVVLHRAVSLDPDAPEAGLEALGVVTRSVTAALLADGEPDMEVIALPRPTPEAVEPEPEPPPPPPPEPRERGRARLHAGYVGTSFAREVAWQSGIGFGFGWVWPFGLHLAAEYAVMQRVRADDEGSAIVVARHPITGAVGYSWRYRRLYIDGEATVVLDYATRHSTSTADELAVAPDRGRFTAALGPRGRIAVIAIWRLEVYAQVGLEFWLARVRYAVQTPQGATHEILAPRRVRGTVGAGLAVRL